MSQIGIDAAKDVMTLADYRRLGNHLENKVINVRRPAAKFADAVLHKPGLYPIREMITGQRNLFSLSS